MGSVVGVFALLTFGGITLLFSGINDLDPRFLFPGALIAGIAGSCLLLSLVLLAAS